MKLFDCYEVVNGMLLKPHDTFFSVVLFKDYTNLKNTNGTTKKKLSGIAFILTSPFKRMKFTDMAFDFRKEWLLGQNVYRVLFSKKCFQWQKIFYTDISYEKGLLKC